MNLIIGRAGTDKLNEILDRVREDIKSNKKVFLIVPEQFTYTFEKKITDSFLSVLNLEILSFSRLVEHILADSKFKNKIYLDDISRHIVLETVLEKLDLQILRNKEKNIESISSIIEELKRYNVNSEDLKKYIDKEKDKDNTNTNININISIIKLEEIYKIYNLYNQTIKDKYLDIADKEFEVISIMQETQVFRDANIYIDQFSKFTQGEYLIIKEMLKQADQVNISITADSIHRKSEYEVFAKTKKTISDLIHISQSNNVKVNIIEKKVNIKHDAEIKNLEESMFKESSIYESKNTGNIKLRVYKNLEDELEDVAENIKQEIIEKKYRYEEIAVVFNDLNNNEELIRRIFNKYDIPIFIQEDKPLEKNSIARFILELLEIISSNYSIESVFSFLKLNYLDLDLNDVYLLEKYVQRWNIRGSKWKSEWKNYDKLKDEDFDRLINLKNSFVNFIEQFKENIGRSKSAKDISREIYNLIDEKQIFNKAIQNISSMDISDFRKIELKEEYIFSLELLKETLDRIVSIKSDEIISYEKYFNIFKLCLKKTKIKKIPSVNDAIHFITTQTTNIEDIKSLYIISMEDGLYPILPSHRGLINDDEKILLKANNIILADTDIERLSEDEFNMYSTLLIPSNSLYLSYNISSLLGEIKRPSIYVNKIKRRLRYLEEEIRIKGLYKEEIRAYSNSALLDKVLSKYLELLEDKEIDDEWKYLIYVLQNTSKEFNIIEQNIINNNIAPNLSMDILEELYKKDLNTSVSKLEEYARCPFSYFAKYILNLREEELYELNPFNTGTLFHDVLETVINKMEEDNSIINNINTKIPLLSQNELYILRKNNKEFNTEFEDVMQNIDNLTLSVLEEKLKQDQYRIFSFSPKFEILTAKFREQILNATRAVVNSLRLSDFKVLGNEINIDNSFKNSQILLDNNKKINIFGMIDRADILDKGDNKYLQIVDYKSSAQDLDENKIREGLQIQLLTYLNILAKEKNIQPFSALYFGLSDYIERIDKGSNIELDKVYGSSYRMKGLIVNDLDIIKLMDKSLKQGNSDILPVGLKADGDLNAYSSVKDKEDFKLLLKQTEDNIRKMSSNILQGDISIYPYKYKKETGCKYCAYSKICQFNLKKNKYRKIEQKVKIKSTKED